MVTLVVYMQEISHFVRICERYFGPEVSNFSLTVNTKGKRAVYIQSLDWTTGLERWTELMD